MRAEEVLDIHLDLFARFNEPGNIITRLVDNAAVEAGLPTAENAEHGTVSASESFRAVLGEATTYRVRESVTDAIRPTAESHSDDMVAGHFPPPHPMGVAVLEKPFAFTENSGREQLVHVITWVPLAYIDSTSDSEPRFGTMALLWNDANREPDYYSKVILRDAEKRGDLPRLRRGGLYFPIQFVHYFNELPAGQMIIEVKEVNKAQIRARGEVPQDLVVSIGRMIMGLWDLMGRIPEAPGALPGQEHVRKTAARRARNEGLTSPTVCEVALHSPRRRVEPDPDRTPGTRAPVEHRVHVREHTRQQAYGPGRSLRKTVTIESYEYGPEDPPDYRPPHRVYRVG
jgi:hypothetical protein